jgi:superfamily I DNA and/or RNA helicase
VDECGMCMEPEVLIPLVSFKPRQVVLVGDHRQLRPIVLCSKARRLGMERSLFERWAGLANNNNKHNQKLFVMLSKQYRMVCICNNSSHKLHCMCVVCYGFYGMTCYVLNCTAWYMSKRITKAMTE